MTRNTKMTVRLGFILDNTTFEFAKFWKKMAHREHVRVPICTSRLGVLLPWLQNKRLEF